jgi:hypothetical protein
MSLNASRLSSSMHEAILAAGVKDLTGQLKSVCDALAGAIVREITTFAEVPLVPPVVVPPLTFSQGAGPAAVPNPIPVPIPSQPIPPGGIK